MADHLGGLVPEFRSKVDALLAQLKAEGIEMRPYFGLRTPEQQAILWRQSRSIEEVAKGIQKLKDGGATYLAHVLEKVGPRYGNPVTNALPGLSWHQWGEALDCYWHVGKTAEWSHTKIIDGVNGYVVYAAHAKQAGLTAGGYWTDPVDWPHVQLRSAASPVSSGLSLADIDKTMQKRFG